MSEIIRPLLVAGARPNFMKIAPLIREMRNRSERFEHILVHTGQHYDQGMSDVFFSDLGIPEPHFHLEVGSGTHARQTAAIMETFEPVLLDAAPNCVLVFGDVNSTLACSVVAKKAGFPVAHIEAGLRSGDMAMPEEINRIVTDSISDLFFVTEPSGVQHLLSEGKPADRIHHVGHVMIDNLLYEAARLEKDGFAHDVPGLKNRFPRYGVVTLHRPSNVDDGYILRGIFSALAEISERLPLVFPVHPRTKASIEKYEIALPSSVVLSPPLGYREFLNLWKDAELVLTDSGGLQEETTGLGVPCLTLRENTERPITCEEGTNRLVGNDPQAIVNAAGQLLNCNRADLEQRRPALWDGRASSRILDVLQAAF